MSMMTTKSSSVFADTAIPVSQLQRLQMFEIFMNQLAGLVTTWSRYGDGSGKVFFPSSPQIEIPELDERSVLPQITIRNGMVECHEQILDFSSRPIALKIFEVLNHAPGYSVGREQLLAQVYNITPQSGYSQRYYSSRLTNLVKMVSRVRGLARVALNNAANAGIEWLPYDAKNKTWSLYHLSGDYIHRRGLHLVESSSSARRGRFGDH